MSTILTILVFVSIVSFPGAGRISNDPSGRYQLRWYEASSDHAHRLFITQTNSNSEHLVMQFNRHIKVSWSPSGNQFAVTDFEGSDSSRVFIYQSRRVNMPIEIRGQLPHSISQLLDGNHHSYLTFVSWRGESGLLLTATGYGDLGTFDKKIECIHQKEKWICADDSRKE